MNKLTFVALLLSITNCIYATETPFEREVIATSRFDFNTYEDSAEVLNLGYLSLNNSPLISFDLDISESSDELQRDWESFFTDQLTENMEVCSPLPSLQDTSNSLITTNYEDVKSYNDNEVACVSTFRYNPDIFFIILRLAFDPRDNDPILVCTFFKNLIYRFRSNYPTTYTSTPVISTKWRREWLNNKRPISIPPYIKFVNLAGQGFNDKDALCFSSFENVKTIKLSLNEVGDETAQVLSTLPALERVNMKNTSLTERGLGYFQHRPTCVIEHDVGVRRCPPAPRKKATLSDRFGSEIDTGGNKKRKL